MSDNWEDWEDAEVDKFIAPLKEELQRLEERKLVEESDNALSKELFETDEYNKLKRVINPEANLEKNFKLEKEKASEKDKEKIKIKINKQKENEQKQKEFSKKNKEQKNNQKRHNELYGEVEGEYIYDDYGDKFYN